MVEESIEHIFNGFPEERLLWDHEVELFRQADRFALLTIWKERNKCIFKSNIRDIEVLWGESKQVSKK
jgi:hypothetical protein